MKNAELRFGPLPRHYLGLTKPKRVQQRVSVPVAANAISFQSSIKPWLSRPARVECPHDVWQSFLKSAFLPAGLFVLLMRTWNLGSIAE